MWSIWTFKPTHKWIDSLMRRFESSYWLSKPQPSPDSVLMSFVQIGRIEVALKVQIVAFIVVRKIIKRNRAPFFPLIFYRWSFHRLELTLTTLIEIIIFKDSHGSGMPNSTRKFYLLIFGFQYPLSVVAISYLKLYLPILILDPSPILLGNLDFFLFKKKVKNVIIDEIQHILAQQ